MFEAPLFGFPEIGLFAFGIFVWLRSYMNYSKLTRVEVWSKNNVRLAVNSGEKKLFSPQSARIC